MSIKGYSLIYLAAFLLSLCGALPAFGAGTLTMSAAGPGVFVLQGTGMDDVAGLDITIAYDAVALSNPRVTQGGLISGAMMAVNPNVPGTVRIAIIRTTPTRGAGDIATIAFDRKGSSPGKILSFTAKPINMNGEPVSVAVKIEDAGDTQKTAPDASSEEHGTRTVITGNKETQPLITGIVVSRQDTTPEKTEKEEVKPSAPEARSEDKQSPVAQDEPAAVAKAGDVKPANDEKAQKNKFKIKKSIPERFQGYRGERTPKAFLDLFTQESTDIFRQEPQVVIADGKASAKIVFIALTNGGAPDFVLSGARLVSLQKDPDNTNTWVVEIRPEKGVCAATLLVPQDNVTMEYPLTVTPKVNVDLDKSGKATEKDFKLFLKERSGPKAAKYDLNGDKRLDYLDDFIFTANYFAAVGNQQKRRIYEEHR